MTKLLDAEVDLTNCDREPIHIPGAILPHGAMLVLDPVTFEVIQAAGAFPLLLGTSIEAVLGTNLSTVFSAQQVAKLRSVVAEGSLRTPRHLLDPLMRVLPDCPLDASIHLADGVLILECEAADRADRFAADPLAGVQEMLRGLDMAPTLLALCGLAAERVREVIGYDRVMVYRFMDDDSGWVVAESREPHLVPFLDLHYPAADIPKQARALYLVSPLRLITQVDYDPAPLIPSDNPRTGRPLDMSHATLRDVSPIHREYLRNMGVNASMSISIVREGRLWGLIACHHYSPRRLPRHLRAICELFGSMLSLQLEARERSEQFEARLASRSVLQSLMRNMAKENDYAVGLTRQSPNLLDYIHGEDSANGSVLIRVDGKITTLGDTPNPEQAAALLDWLVGYMEGREGVFSTDRLSELWPPAAEFAASASGLLAIAVSREPFDFILWFRPEVVHTVRWGGDPTKPVTMGPNGARLTPRQSFEAWKQTVRGRSAPWIQTDIDAAYDLRVSLLEVVLRRIDAVVRERMIAAERDALLMAELDHRVKNTLANIQALVTQTSRSAASLSEFVNGLEGRIHSMARAHSLLTQGRWQGVSIASLLGEELEPYGQGGAEIAFDGPAIVLTPKSALALSLAVHELATNAAKYGALSRQGGAVAIRWQLSIDKGITLSWRESGGPPVLPPTRRGFGSQLIERALAMETGGRATMHFDAAGLACDIELPRASTVIVEPVDLPAPAYVAPVVAMPPRPDRQARVLIVEDSALVAMTLEQMIQDLGWDTVGPAATLSEAMALAKREPLDAALLDVDLGGEMSWDVALELKRRNIPFAFSTGFDGATVLPAALADSIVIGKPYRMQDVERRLRQMIGTQPPLGV